MYSPQDVVGKNGLEYAYESVLKGTNGHDLVEVDAAGMVVKSLGQLPSSPGATLRVTLDKGLQEVIYAQFAGKQHMKGAAVALDPRTGAVLALVSFPSFDSNAFAQGISASAYQVLLNNKQLPLFNRVIGAQLPPGSTVKPMVGLAALQEGVVTDRTIIYDRGKITVPNQFNPAISYDFVGWKRTGLGPMTVRSAIASSSDIYFYVVGGGYPGTGVDGLGIERLAAYYRKFNLGKPTGIDLPGEKPGVVPDPDWKASYFKSDPILRKWYLGDTFNYGIGQGYLLTTPLQVNFMTTVVANGGDLFKPHIIKGTGEKIKENLVKNEYLNLVLQGMKESCEVGGVAWPFFDFKVKNDMLKIDNTNYVEDASGSSSMVRVKVGCKTGTAETGGNETKPHAWITVIAPFYNPEVVVTVLVENGGEGSSIAGPVARDILKVYFERKKN
jgi:penicillin-binding protein 2